MASLVDIQFMMHALHQKRLFHLDDISSFWTAFTKCKRQIRDGFRLENLSWRLWYREAIMRKQCAQEPSWQDIELPQKTQQLRRIQSMPSLGASQHTPHFQPLRKPAESVNAKAKFFIDDDASDSEDDDFSDSESLMTMAEDEKNLDDSMDDDNLFVKRVLTTAGDSALHTSLLSYMLKEQAKEDSSVYGLRRCHTQYTHLDEWFTNADRVSVTTVTR